MNQEDNKKEMKRAQRLVKIGGLLVVLALVGLLALSLASCGSSDKEKMQQQLDSLKLANEKLQLTGEYESLNQEFLQYENQAQYLQNDSLLEQYSQAKDKVEKLLAELKMVKTTNRKRISELQNEISTLKGLLRHYVAVIDSLGKENSELRDINEKLQSQRANLRNESAKRASSSCHLPSRKTTLLRLVKRRSMYASSVRKALSSEVTEVFRSKAEMFPTQRRKSSNMTRKNILSPSITT